jgi:hypothetical protein
MNALHAIFKKISDIEPSVGLEKRILRKIALQNRLALRRKLAFIYAGFMASSGAFAWAVFTLGRAVLQSDFWTLAKLIFSDTGLVFQNWVDFIYSLLETLPVLTIAIILLPIFTLFISINSYLNLNNKNNLKHIPAGGMCA